LLSAHGGYFSSAYFFHRLRQRVEAGT
jgi:hypothetical protein